MYLFSAFMGTLPEAFTYAEYARRGFFEMCAIAGINLAVLLVAHLIVQREYAEEPKVLRVQTIVLSLFTTLLIVIGLSKMMLYIEAYGLTPLRVYTSWFMVLLFLVFAVVMIRQLKRFNASRIIIAGFVVWFLILSYGNVDGMIANYNIRQYEEGSLQTLDIEALGSLSDAVVPPLYKTYQQLDTTNASESILAERIIAAIGEYSEESSGNENRREESQESENSKRKSRGFLDYNYQRYQADEIRETLSGQFIRLPDRSL
jgi:hypothetical protein